MNITAVLIACCLAYAGSAAAITFDCPRTLEIQQTATLADKSWDQVADRGIGPASLQTIAVYTDHPSKSGSLVPDQTKQSGQMEITIWRLPQDPAPYWMACIYANSRVMLAKSVPKDAKQCQMTESLLNKKPNGVISFICK